MLSEPSGLVSLTMAQACDICEDADLRQVPAADLLSRRNDKLDAP